jgi:hypothetical protein
MPRAARSQPRRTPELTSHSVVIASAAKQSTLLLPTLDCFVASLLAMTEDFPALRCARLLQCGTIVASIVVS